MRLIDADKLVDELKSYVSKIKNIRSDDNCFLAEEDVLDLIESQESISAIHITEIKKHRSDFSDLELTEEFVEEQLDKYDKTLKWYRSIEEASRQALKEMEDEQSGSEENITERFSNTDRE